MGNNLEPQTKQEQILQFIDSIMVSPAEFRQEVILSLKKCFGYERATFFLINEKGEMVAPVTMDIDDYFCNIYSKYYYQKDIFEPGKVADKAKRQKILTVHDVMAKSQFEMTEYYNEFLTKQDIHHEVAMFLSNETKLTGVIGLYRPKQEKEFSLQEIGRLQKLSYYISKMLDNHLLYMDAEHQKKLLETSTQSTSVGLIVFDQFLKVYYCNETFEAVSKKYLPEYVYNIGQAFINRFLKNDNWKNGLQKVIFDNGRIRLKLHVIPSFSYQLPSSMYMAYFCQEDFEENYNAGMDFSSKASLSTLLSKRESEVLELMVKGMSNKEIADSLYLSIHTVKTHMQNIFKKFNAKNRTELSYKLRNSKALYS